ncbi:MAG: hypothetical protein H7330_05225 [Hymenobacteraceae bacterium]|nr:hypothetical protein [Hymenobacteraceae bacterium]
MAIRRNEKLAYWLLPAVALPVGAWLLGRWLVARAVRGEVEKLFADPAAAPANVYQPEQLAGLPPPVQRYFRRVLRPGQPYLRSVRLRHDGQFRAGLNQGWMPITGEEYFRADAPGFVWVGTTASFTACDQYVAGRGARRAWLLGALPVVRGQGAVYDQGELLRWLAESVWFPTSLLPGAHVGWSPIDDRSATLTLSDHRLTVVCVMHFNAEDEIGRGEMYRARYTTYSDRWVARYAAYREWHGVRIPTQAEVTWEIDGVEHPYARFTVRVLDYAQPRAFD